MSSSQRHPFLAEPLPWHFPLANTHHGIPLSNGTFGALIWGGDQDLRITVNRADYWDHRGGVVWTEEATYQNLKTWLELGDEENLRRVFEGERTSGDDEPARPTRLPMGRVDLRLPAGVRLRTGRLDLASSEACVEAAPGGKVRGVLVRHDPVLALVIEDAEVTASSMPPNAEPVLEHFRKYGFPPAEVFDEEDRGGWVQECPGEPAMCVAWRMWKRNGHTEMFVTSVYGASAQEARQNAERSLEEHAEAGFRQCAERTANWWSGYWARIAALDLPSREDLLLYYLGMYKLAGLSVPGSPAATLQGPWVEEYCMPPWSSDYHFNINVQECYWPAYAGNYLPSLEPLWEMLADWEPRLRENARLFAGVPDGLQLPHAVDDRCTCMGGFWTGSVDHGSTMWTGQLMWLRWRYSMDRDFLEKTAYPFIKGAMRVYEAMLEETEEGWRLPVSVSPEFGGANFSAWGANASFQLANIHFACRALIEASELLGVDETDRARWRDIAARLPEGCTSPDGRELWLWEGQPLSESHRHHSHLAGLYPFDVFDYFGKPEHRELIDASMKTLTRQGMGMWTGWCMPWAAILHARTGNGEMAQVLLDTFRRVFMNPGYATGHDARFPGFTVMAGRPEIMQIEASMAAAAAVLELVVQCARGVVRVFGAVPNWWRDVSFQGVRAEGAFMVSGRMRDGVIEEIRLLSEAGAPLNLANPWGGPCRVQTSRGQTRTPEGTIIAMETEPGEEIVVTPFQ